MENAADNLVGGIAVYFLIIVGCAYIFDCGMKIHDWFRKHFPKKEKKTKTKKWRNYYLKDGKRVYTD